MVTPTGMLSLPIDYLRNTVASSSTFRTWTSTASEALAKVRVHAVSAASNATAPLAVAGWLPGYTRTKVGGASRNHFEGQGQLILLFRAAISEAANADAEYDFLNKVGAVVSEMELVAGTATYLDIESITLSDGPYRPEENESQGIGNYYEALFTIEFASL